jgi:hypothetical protein
MADRVCGIERARTGFRPRRTILIAVIRAAQFPSGPSLNNLPRFARVRLVRPTKRELN